MVSSAMAESLEAECVKTQLFRKTMETVFKKICGDIDEKVMQECYGKFLGLDTAAISKIHSRFIDGMEKDFKQKIDELVVEENLNEKFLELQKLEEEASTENVKWLPSRDCSSDIRSHDYQKLIQFKQELQVLVEKEEAEVEKMKIKVEDVRKQQLDLQDKVSFMNGVSSKIDSSTESMENIISNIISNMEYI